jgi:glucose 1-dehydrogenase
MTTEQKLKDRVAIVTGADSGIGQSVAIVFARAGADVVITYRSDEDGAKETAKRVEETGRKALVVRTDVGIESEVKNLFDKTLSEFKRLDILVNNAGELPKAN